MARWDENHSLKPTLSPGPGCSRDAGLSYPEPNDCEVAAFLATGVRRDLPMLARAFHEPSELGGPPVGCSVSTGSDARVHYNPWPNGTGSRCCAGSPAVPPPSKPPQFRSVCRASGDGPDGPCGGNDAIHFDGNTYNPPQNTKYNATVPVGSVCYAKCKHDDAYYDL